MSELLNEEENNNADDNEHVALQLLFEFRRLVMVVVTVLVNMIVLITIDHTLSGLIGAFSRLRINMLVAVAASHMRQRVKEDVA